MSIVFDPPEASITDHEIDHAEAVHEQAGCPNPADCADILNVCVCGDYVCPEHTPGFVECVEVGNHHETCADDCTDCVTVRARDWADDRARTGGKW